MFNYRILCFGASYSSYDQLKWEKLKQESTQGLPMPQRHGWFMSYASGHGPPRRDDHRAPETPAEETHKLTFNSKANSEP